MKIIIQQEDLVRMCKEYIKHLGIKTVNISDVDFKATRVNKTGQKNPTYAVITIIEETDTFIASPEILDKTNIEVTDATLAAANKKYVKEKSMEIPAQSNFDIEPKKDMEEAEVGDKVDLDFLTTQENADDISGEEESIFG